MTNSRCLLLAASLLSLNVLLSPVVAAQVCGQSVACQVSGEDGGTYYVTPPSVGTEVNNLPIFVFFHGHNGSGAGVVRNKGLIGALNRAGFVVVAPDGPQFTFNGRTSRGWAARPEGESPRGGRDDIKFVENVLLDVSRRYPVDLDKTVMSGFSSGGSMAWYFSCYSKAPLAGVVAVAGGLRRPLPVSPLGAGEAVESVATTCPGGPRKLIHIHGFVDRQVPLEGRGIRAWHQGDVFEGLSVQRQTNQCGSRPDKVAAKGAYWCREWNKCTSQQPVRLCLHAGGHGMPKNWLRESLDWLQK
ncbi:MAG: alpha/beta fold hydrolase [Rhizobiaceae bacterium]